MSNTPLMPIRIYLIESTRNRDFVLKTFSKEGAYRCCELMNELESGELGVPKFSVRMMEVE